MTRVIATLAQHTPEPQATGYQIHMPVVLTLVMASLASLVRLLWNLALLISLNTLSCRYCTSSELSCRACPCSTQTTDKGLHSRQTVVMYTVKTDMVKWGEKGGKSWKGNSSGLSEPQVCTKDAQGIAKMPGTWPCVRQTALAGRTAQYSHPLCGNGYNAKTQPVCHHRHGGAMLPHTHKHTIII